MTNQRRSGLGNQQSTVVNSLVNQARVRQEEIKAESEGRDGRGKPGHGQRKGVDKTGRPKFTADISEPVQNGLRQIAEESEIALKDLAEAALRGFVNGYRDGRIDLSDFLVRARSLKAMYELELPDDFSLFS